MRNVLSAIREANGVTRYYVIIDSDIATGKCLAYNPEVGVQVVVPYKDLDIFQARYIEAHPFDWMITFDTNSIEVDPNWMNK